MRAATLIHESRLSVVESAVLPGFRLRLDATVSRVDLQMIGRDENEEWGITAASTNGRVPALCVR